MYLHASFYLSMPNNEAMQYCYGGTRVQVFTPIGHPLRLLIIPILTSSVLYTYVYLVMLI